MNILERIQKERENQISIYGKDHDLQHSAVEWMGLLTHHVGKLLFSPSKSDWSSRMIKIAALSMAAVESLEKIELLSEVQNFYTDTMTLLDPAPSPSLILKGWEEYKTKMVREDTIPYHNYLHINQMIKMWNKIAEIDPSVKEMPAAVRLAVLFHDYIYNTLSPNNEKNSVAAMKDHLFFYLSDSPKETIEAAEKLILSTINHQPNDDVWSKIFLDLDLSILASDSNTFQHYEDSIRKEYHWVEESLYRENRNKLMKSFLKDDLFHHYYFKSCQKQLKENLKHYA